ncbi:MAG: tetratricopeptide repeat protein, partial [Chthoniobacterales bacterium]
SDVAQKIASSLEAKLTGREKKDISADTGTKIPEAYEAYLQALALEQRQGPEALEKGIAFSRRAVELDPNYAQAWAQLAIAESQKSGYEHTPAQLQRARLAAQTALRLAPELPAAHKAMGSFYYYCLSDYDRALSELNMAREQEPNNANTILSIALVQRRQGKLDASINLQQQASKLDPLNEDIWANLGRSFRAIRDFEEARAIFDRALTIVPGDPEILAQKAETYLAQGDLDTAWAMIKDLKLPPTSWGFGTYFTLLVYQRRYDDVIARVSSLLAKEKELPPAFVTIGHAALGGLYRLKGDGAQAQTFLLQSEQELNEMRAHGVPVDGDLLLVEARLGRRDQVEQLADAFLRRTEKDKWEFPGSEVAVAKAYSTLGEFDRALPLLQQALSAPYVQSLTPAYLRYDPEWDPVRNDPRFQKLENGH